MSAGQYLTLGGSSTGELREKASRFIAHAFPIADEEDFRVQREAIAAKHRTARHICHAWVLGQDGERFRSFDAGEPSGTAGKPILRQLQGAKLTFCAIVVVRYFGGTLLGKAGLSHAFAGAAREALACNAVVERIVLHPLTLHSPYAHLEAVRHDVLQGGGEVRGMAHAAHCTLQVALPAAAVEALRSRWERRGIRAEG